MWEGYIMAEQAKKEAKEKTKKVHWVFDKDSGIMSVDMVTSIIQFK